MEKRLKSALEKVTGLFSNRFDFKQAQDYELQHSYQWIQENFENLFSQIEAAETAQDFWPGPENLVVKEFFAGSHSDWQEFASFIEDKTSLEVGAGPCGALAIWWWGKRRIIVDPLAAEHKRISLELFRKTWFGDNVELYSQPAEQLIPELVGKVDGAVICRNALDHAEDPMVILDNISAYAKHGCYLLLWTDLWHLKGHDRGHRNITKDKLAIEKKLKAIGFEILYAFSDARADGSSIEYGCLARRNQNG